MMNHMGYNIDRVSGDANVAELVGQTFERVVRTSIGIGYSQDSILFIKADGDGYMMSHDQSCCESVYIESINGELSDLEGSPLVVAEERISEGQSNECSTTWTFYTFATVKGGHVDIRWNGESNGYYSESVDWCRIKATKEGGPA